MQRKGNFVRLFRFIYRPIELICPCRWCGRLNKGDVKVNIGSLSGFMENLSQCFALVIKWVYNKHKHSFNAQNFNELPDAITTYESEIFQKARPFHSTSRYRTFYARISVTNASVASIVVRINTTIGCINTILALINLITEGLSWDIFNQGAIINGGNIARGDICRRYCI